MSFSNNTAQHNPSAKWYEWNGEDGYLTSFDKSQKNSENKGKVKTDIPFKFILLDATSCIKGFSEEHGFIYSNEVKDTTTQPFYVKAHKGKMLASGIYNSIKGNLAVLKCRFNKNIYIVRKNENKQLELCTLQLKGAALQSWSDFCKENKIYNNTCHKAITISSIREGKKGNIKFKIPVFSIIDEEIKDSVKKVAEELDKNLQEYFASYFTRKASMPEPHVEENPMPELEQEEESFPKQPISSDDDF